MLKTFWSRFLPQKTTVVHVHVHRQLAHGEIVKALAGGLVEEPTRSFHIIPGCRTGVAIKVPHEAP